ncbi:CHAT domain-containing protein [Micromonospora echinospora]|uniref:CHAT domain-containing protein n=1 Tax=Micromonospora echinospora TaxID=1877 RepID=UPI003A89A160
MPREPYRNHLPKWFLSEDVLPFLSFDAYIYYHCDACGMYLGLNPALLTDRTDIRKAFPCSVCGMRGHLTLRTFPMRWLLNCDDCGQTWGELHAGFFYAPTCATCGSGRNTAVESEPLEPLPSVLADSASALLWGVDPKADVEAIMEGLRLNSRGPDRARYLIPAALFAERLYRWNDYPRDRWRLRDLQGRLLHQYFKAVGLVSAGRAAARALAGLAEGDDAPESVADMANLCNETAYACYSLLRLAGVDGEVFDMAEVREVGSRIGRKAIAAYAELERLDPVLIGGQIARTWFLVGDIHRTGSFELSQFDEALACYDRAQGEPHIPADVRAWVEEARQKVAEVIAGLQGTESVVGRQPPVDYDRDDWTRLSRETRCYWLFDAAITLEADGRLGAAEEALHRAQRLALDEFGVAPDVSTLRSRVRIFSRVFDHAAHLNVRLARPHTAVEAIDSVRAVVLSRSYVASGEEERELARNVTYQTFMDFLGRAEEAPRFSALVDLEIPETRDHLATDTSLAKLTRSGWPDDMAIGTFVVSAQKVSLVLARRRADGWQLEATQAPAPAVELMRTIELLNLKPGIFRERRLRQLCSALSGALLSELRPWLLRRDVTRLAVSVPGSLSYVPIEALFGDEGPEVCFVPSLRVASAMADKLRPVGPFGRALVVGYDGVGLVRVREEIGRLRELYGGRLDEVSPRISKRDLLAKLTSTDYDIIHFACHGSFALGDEALSALHLSTVEGRPVLLEAHELAGARLARSAVVVLSACESGLSSLGHANNYDGLNGAFLRMGARGIIGSRWPVYDDAAFGFMDRLHTRLAAGVSPERAVAAAQADMRPTHGIEDWAAFFYLGLPGLDNEKGAMQAWK